jgi:hypothetical protein
VGFVLNVLGRAGVIRQSPHLKISKPSSAVRWQTSCSKWMQIHGAGRENDSTSEMRIRFLGAL